MIAQAGLIALFHSGTTGIGAGMPGGGGVHLKYSNPMCIDDVAADFPDLRIILAHPSFPWQDEALAIAVHKPNVYIDLSGWSPKYFPDILVRYINTLLKAQDAVRLRLPSHHPRPLARRLPTSSPSRTKSARSFSRRMPRSCSACERGAASRT